MCSRWAKESNNVVWVDVLLLYVAGQSAMQLLLLPDISFVLHCVDGVPPYASLVQRNCHFFRGARPSFARIAFVWSTVISSLLPPPPPLGGGGRSSFRSLRPPSLLACIVQKTPFRSTLHHACYHTPHASIGHVTSWAKPQQVSGGERWSTSLRWRSRLPLRLRRRRLSFSRSRSLCLSASLSLSLSLPPRSRSRLRLRGRRRSRSRSLSLCLSASLSLSRSLSLSLSRS